MSTTMAIGRNSARQVFETIQETPDGKQRTDKLVDILSEAVYAYLKQKALVRRESALRGKEN